MKQTIVIFVKTQLMLRKQTVDGFLLCQVVLSKQTQLKKDPQHDSIWREEALVPLPLYHP